MKRTEKNIHALITKYGLTACLTTFDGQFSQMVRLRTTWLWVRDQLQSLRTISDLEIVLGWWKRNQH